MAMDDVFLYCRYQFPLSLTLRTNAIANSIFSWLIVLTINSTFFMEVSTILNFINLKDINLFLETIFFL